MAGYTSKKLDLDDADVAVLRQSDAALVAAGLAAVWSGAPVFRSAVLAQGTFARAAGADAERSGERANVASFIRFTTALSVAEDGTTAPFTAEDLLGKSILGGLFLELPFETTADAEPASDDVLLGRLTELIDLLKAFQDHDVRIELAPRISPLLDFSVPSVHARPVQLPQLPRRDGSGVIVGIADWGCDFAHPAFRHPDGSTRLLYLWDQNPAPPLAGLGVPGPFGIGRLFDLAAINAALATASPYFALGYNPVTNAFGELPPVHGTHVLSVAAGSEAVGVPPGVAPGADLIFVNLPPNALVSAPGRLALLDAVLWMFDTANTSLGRPTVVNLSLGTNYGPHDGTSLLEIFFDWVIGQPVQMPGRVVVVPAGNARTSKLHARGVIATGGVLSITWKFQRADTTVNTLDIWYETPTPAPLLLTSLIQPGGGAVAQTSPVSLLFLLYGGRLIGSLTTATWPVAANPPFLQNIHIEIAPDQAIAEDWGVRLLLPAGSGVTSVTVDAWVNRDDLIVGADTQSWISEKEADPLGTLASLSCGHHTICAGAYYEIPQDQPPAYFSSAGPTRDGRPKPDVAAPGYQVLAANALGGQRVDAQGDLNLDGPDVAPLLAAMSGTSVSAAFVSGLVALLLQTRPLATANQVASKISEWTQLLPPTLEPPATFQPPPRNWEPGLGYGRIDAAATLWHWP